MSGITGVMFAVKAAFSILETAKNIAAARASRFDFDLVFAPLPAGNPLEVARQQLSKSENFWTDAFLNAFLASPQSAVPGTIMAFSGLEDPTDRDAIIAYLNSLD